MSNPLDQIAGVDAPKLLAFMNRFGRKNFDDYLAGRKNVTIEDVVPLLIGGNMRFVIPEGFEFGHTDLNPNYFWEQSTEKFNTKAFVKRGARYLPKGVKMPTAAQLDGTWNELEREITADEQVSNLFKVKDPRRGVRLRFFIPQMDVDESNIGAFIHNVLKAVIKAAYEEQFPDRKFVDYRKDDTDGNVTIVDEGQKKLISMIKSGAVAGWLFPPVFQGIGIEGDRALMKLLPQKYNWSLGGIESLVATVLHTKTLCRDVMTPVQDLASFQWQGADYSLCLYAIDVELEFDRRYLNAYGDYSAALSVFRQC